MNAALDCSHGSLSTVACSPLNAFKTCVTILNMATRRWKSQCRPRPADGRCLWCRHVPLYQVHMHDDNAITLAVGGPVWVRYGDDGAVSRPDAAVGVNECGCLWHFRFVFNRHCMPRIVSDRFSESKGGQSADQSYAHQYAPLYTTLFIIRQWEQIVKKTNK